MEVMEVKLLLMKVIGGEIVVNGGDGGEIVDDGDDGGEIVVVETMEMKLWWWRRWR